MSSKLLSIERSIFFAPIRKSQSKPIRLPRWFDNSIKNLRSRRNKAHGEWISNKSNANHFQKFRILRKKFDNVVKAAKKRFYSNKFDQCIRDSRQTFKLLNEIRGKQEVSISLPILTSCTTDSNHSPSQSDIAETFNRHFITIGEKVQKDLPSLSPLLPDSVSHSMVLYNTNVVDVNRVMDNLNNKSSSGVDYISNKIVKITSRITAPCFTCLINQSFDEGNFPSELSKA